MKKKNVEELVAAWTEEIIDGTDRELVDVEFVKEGSDWVLRVFLDKPGGIDVEDCRTVSQSLSERLDDNDPIPNAYSLEVSSPGLERPLKKDEDFVRFTGKKIHIKGFSPIDGKKELQGTLQGFEDGIVRLMVGKKLLEVPKEQIAKAHLAVEF